MQIGHCQQEVMVIGQRIKNEATLKSLEVAFNHIGAGALVSYIAPSNQALKHLAERLGAQYEQTMELLELGPHGVYRHPRP